LEAEKFGILNFIFHRKAFFSILTILYLLLTFPVAEAGNERTVALVMKALSNPFFFKMEEGARKYAQEEKNGINSAGGRDGQHDEYPGHHR
jgi:ABC-type sugar transport system substrate-binding protein